ncbi:odorant receptor 46a-like isoform X1 [Harpegnathos saltator]|uniref:odorant receptor 46a-like isoform X1 n=1 Tax=Harpegnathos saltator TaxID=610380 RepID=UPI000949106A|nr:odorant receptor 46a-like isoform X1 [Harpegnathos saltator]
MQILRLNFLIYTVGGVWRPIAWSSNTAKFLYNAFTVCTIVPLYFLMLTQLMDIVLIVDNMDDFTTNSLMFMTIVAVCCKATIAVLRRNGIIGLVQMLLTEPCRPRDEEEVAIQTKFNKFIRSWSIRYSLLASGSVTGVTIKSVLNIMHGILPYRVWLPYDPSVSLMFWTTSVMQIVSVIFTTIINVGTETLVFGFFLQTCAQFEILESRLQKLVIGRTRSQLKKYTSHKTETAISKHVHHHLRIFEYARTVNSIFNQILFVQFFSSILILCTSVYYLSSHITESESATLIIYTICMFVQIYVYCWSGNEVILKSANIGDAVYQMDWPALSVSEKKNLLMIMKRSTVPIKFTSSFLITLSLQSYSNVSIAARQRSISATAPKWSSLADNSPRYEIPLSDLENIVLDVQCVAALVRYKQ